MRNSLTINIPDGTQPCGVIALTGNNKNIAESSKLQRENNSLTLQLFPNPSATEFTLVIKSNSNSAVTIKVVNMFGKIVYTTQGSVHQHYLFGNHLSSGIYPIQIIHGTTIKIIKAVKGG